jgi:membrane protein implicated in regulation of membrane protease activity
MMKKRDVAISGRTLKAEESYGLGKLCFATAMGLAAAVAAVFTTMLPMAVGWRYVWLTVCVASFLLAMVAVVLFSQRPKPESAAALLEHEGQHSSAGSSGSRHRFTD